ncbi:hypothetical protein BDB01DRAFT_810320 [Pilobolus umbonatus]|nr:hypothetical protein BDB01DRAFT_810320 [Pilobolus umbonatus]
MSYKQAAADDDLESRRIVRRPEMCVDYLSYQFDEMDLAASWRVMTKQKKEIVDGLRLENASWRTWAKQRNNLKTISPQSLNWLKDSDVTWLYGPLHTVIRTEEDPFLNPRPATTEDKLGLMMLTNEIKPLKSVLKKISEKERLKKAAATQKVTLVEANQQLKAMSPLIMATHRQPRLRFNSEVEQCIALQETHNDTEESEDEAMIYPCTDRPRSIKIIEPAKLKKSQSDVEDDGSSTHSVIHTNAVDTISCDLSTSDEEEEEEEEVKRDSFYTRPTPGQSDRQCVDSRPLYIRPIPQPYKAHAAEPALVTMNQTATTIEKKDRSNLLDFIASWATSYLWKADKKRTTYLPSASSQPISIPNASSSSSTTSYSL